jgi:LPXTG-site transpeptidase (sortase) family protein
MNRNNLMAKIALTAAVLLLPAALFAQAARCEAFFQPGGPRLMRVSPSANGMMVGRDMSIVLSFDRPMDGDSILQAASFEPQISFSVSGEAECLIVPSNLLPGSREYTFHLQAGVARDRSGRVFENDVKISFATRNDGMAATLPAMPFSGSVVEGSNPVAVVNALGSGLGHYPGTGRPGGGNLVLMAHASGQIDFPFNGLQKLKPGDEVGIRYGAQCFVYRVEETMVVPESATWILDPKEYPIVTIFVCSAANGQPSPTLHPPYRYVVRAALSSATWGQPFPFSFFPG